MIPLFPSPLPLFIISPRYLQKQPGLQGQGPAWLKVQHLRTETMRTAPKWNVVPCKVASSPSIKISNRNLDDSLSGYGRRIYATAGVWIIFFHPALDCDFKKVCKEECGVVRGKLDHLPSFAVGLALPGTALTTRPHFQWWLNQIHESHPDQGPGLLRDEAFILHGAFALECWDNLGPLI